MKLDKVQELYSEDRWRYCWVVLKWQVSGWREGVMAFLTNGSSFVFFILYLDTKNCHSPMKFSDDTKLGDILNGKRACSTEDLQFVVFCMLLSVSVMQPMYQVSFCPEYYTKPHDILCTKKKNQVRLALMRL